jgi:hypothetical protein
VDIWIDRDSKYIIVTQFVDIGEIFYYHINFTVSVNKFCDIGVWHIRYKDKDIGEVSK